MYEAFRTEEIRGLGENKDVECRWLLDAIANVLRKVGLRALRSVSELEPLEHPSYDAIAAISRFLIIRHCRIADLMRLAKWP